MQDPPPLARFQAWLAPALAGPPLLAFLPALSLGAFWLGGERALVVTSLGLPLFFAIAGTFGRKGRALGSGPEDGQHGRTCFETDVAGIVEALAKPKLKSVCLMLEIEELQEVVGRHGPAAADMLMERVSERMVAALRPGDRSARLGETRFGICLAPVRQLDLELSIQLAGRLQLSVEEPIDLDGVSIYLSCTIGFCLSGRRPGRSAQDWIAAATAALADAKRNGPSSIRSFSPRARNRAGARSDLQDDAAKALENGQIHPWFQPQISTDTGRVSGFEALARWTHPERGVIAPADFLPVLEESGQIERLGQVILAHALKALRSWDEAGVHVPSIGVNFTSAELCSPTLPERVNWELDRFDLAPSRLAVEILETVVTDSSDDTLTHTVRALGKLGCRIDLDDFGTGHASIAAIRRFDISRIKIDRCFIAKADQDPDQQRMITAILTMAEQLGLETLGV